MKYGVLMLALISLLIGVFYLGRYSVGHDWINLAILGFYAVAASVWYAVIAHSYRADREANRAFREEMSRRKTKDQQ